MGLFHININPCRLAKGGRAPKKRKLDPLTFENKIQRISAIEGFAENETPKTSLETFAADVMKRAEQEQIPIESLIECVQRLHNKTQ